MEWSGSAFKYSEFFQLLHGSTLPLLSGQLGLITNETFNTAKRTFLLWRRIFNSPSHNNHQVLTFVMWHFQKEGKNLRWYKKKDAHFYFCIFSKSPLICCRSNSRNCVQLWTGESGLHSVPNFLIYYMTLGKTKNLVGSLFEFEMRIKITTLANLQPI